mmetsp:Transcript_7484/g.16379  ORF Transcript_7484/g.16379 Transcript_7484/m.16379 type:complete len:584 (+) Transcript_7484:90-1841(+)
MSATAEDLFGDSSSDDESEEELLGAAKKSPTTTKKKAGKDKTASAASSNAAVFDSSSDDSDFDSGDDAGAKPDAESEDEAAGLFDSDDSDDEDAAAAAAKKKKRKKKAAAKKLSKKSKKKSKKRKRGGAKGADDDSDDDEAPGRKLSKRERMEALRAKKRHMERSPGAETETSLKPSDSGDEASKKKKQPGDDGYDSGDSYASDTFVRTKEDDDFIDNEGEDPDALRELYAEQHFDDERGEGTDSEDERSRKKGGKVGRRKKGPDALSDDDMDGEEVPDNPIMAAVHRMKKKKKKPKKLSELEDEAKEFLTRMQEAADEDDAAVKERRPATKKLAMLNETLDVLARKDLTRPLLDMDLLMVAAAWVRPLPNGQLGNITVRAKLLQAIGKMNGENGITAVDLKRSNFGKVVMSLYMHKSETPDLKRQHKALIEQWSRPIFQKSGNMRDLEKVQESRGGTAGGIAGIARAQAMARSRGAAESSAAAAAGASTPDGGGRDMSAIISRGSESGRDLGTNRVRVPFSKGFQFSVRPSDKTGSVQDRRTYATSVKDNREALHKKMLDKSRPVSKNQRSANISIEGRPAK